MLVADTLHWLRQVGRVHTVAEFTHVGEAIPHCRVTTGKPFVGTPKAAGHGLRDAQLAGTICTKCRAHLPKHIRRMLDEQ